LDEWKGNITASFFAECSRNSFFFLPSPNIIAKCGLIVKKIKD
jgi:hypothetical protein